MNDTNLEQATFSHTMKLKKVTNLYQQFWRVKILYT